MREGGKGMQNFTRLSQGQKGYAAALAGDRRFLNRITVIGLTVGCLDEYYYGKKSVRRKGIKWIR
jgi:hypothetical protein